MVSKKQLFVSMVLSVSVCFAADNDASGLTKKQREAKQLADLFNQASKMRQEKRGVVMILPKDNTVTVLEGSEHANEVERSCMIVNSILKLAFEGKLGTPVDQDPEQR